MARNRAEAECIEAGDPFVTELSRYDDDIAHFLAYDPDWQRVMNARRDLDTYETAVLARWWALVSWPEGHA